MRSEILSSAIDYGCEYNSPENDVEVLHSILGHIPELKDRDGLDVWAERVGRTLTHYVRRRSFDSHHAQLAAVAAVGLKSAIMEIKANPELTSHFIEGMIQELESSRLFDERSVNPAYKPSQSSGQT
ncbi:hypothetical protein KKA69_03460 [Patescibacteria group bacterium]|nr:hypothetical protein [Patescibacteria group bacterium]